MLNSSAAKASSDPIMYTIRDILKTCPKCHKDVPAIVDVAKLFGGSSSNAFVTPLLNFIRAFARTDVEISGAVWKAIANLELLPGDWSPHFINSVIAYVAAVIAKAKKGVRQGHISRFLRLATL